MSTYRQIITLLLLYPEADWNWHHISLRPDIPFWLVLAYPEWKWDWTVIGMRFPRLIVQHPELPLKEIIWSDLVECLDLDFIDSHPELEWGLRLLEDPFDIFRYPNVRWNYINAIEFMTSRPDILWPYECISREAGIFSIRWYPNFPWVFDIVWPRVHGILDPQIIKDHPNWPWTEEQRRLALKPFIPQEPWKIMCRRNGGRFLYGHSRRWSSYKEVQMTIRSYEWFELSKQDFTEIDAKNTIVRAWRRFRWWRRVKFLRFLWYLEYRGYGCGVPMELWAMVMRYVR